jgi:HlyD family secretion protein
MSMRAAAKFQHWVTANFKETQLKHMRASQHVKISVDTYGRKYDGHVVNIAGASGARYSLLPPENATGNYVKVVQRIPVKIVFEKGQDPEHLLRPGMSVDLMSTYNKHRCDLTEGMPVHGLESQTLSHGLGASRPNASLRSRRRLKAMTAPDLIGCRHARTTEPFRCADPSHTG